MPPLHKGGLGDLKTPLHPPYTRGTLANSIMVLFDPIPPLHKGGEGDLKKDWSQTI